MLKIFPALLMLILVGSLCPAQRIEVTVPSNKPLNGHLILVIAKQITPSRAISSPKHTTPPRPSASMQKTSRPARRSSSTQRPSATLAAPSLISTSGDYYLQAVFNVYEQFHLASGKASGFRPTKAKASTGI